MSFDFIDTNYPQDWDSKLKPNTRAIYTESLINPVLSVPHHSAIVAFAKQHRLVSMVDNTFTSPINFRPLEMGYDLTLHSCTKYLNGHSDLAAGAVIGKTKWVERIHNKLNHLGASLDPHTCFLLNRGMKTLPVRIKHQNQTAQKVAEFLEEHPGVGLVNYPGLPCHPFHQRAVQWFHGFGGMVSFETKSDATTILNRLELITHTFSLGGVESLAVQPSKTSHLEMNPEERRSLGIPDNLVRLSVGLEAPDDIIEDLEKAMS